MIDCLRATVHRAVTLVAIGGLVASLLHRTTALVLPTSRRTNNRHGGARLSPPSSSYPPVLPASSTALRGVFDDDLPNLAGINPVEATFILGVLYYFFGSETIYEYAREAGRLFTTYVPIVKDLTFDISREFRDYFEENRERDLMRKAGVDVDKVPRRTSNVIERFQEGLKTQQDTDAAAQEVRAYDC